MKQTLLVGLSIILINLVSSKNPPTVDLGNLGKVEGGYGKSLHGRSFYSFQGIPYAEPPVGTRRFEESTLVKPWDGVLKAQTVYTCMQYNQFTPPGEDYVTGDEDCLYLNIYTPTLNQNANLDVVVYIHGGAFMFGSGHQQGPEYLLDKDVVVVTFNYRLGPLGFLSTENNLVPGNNGLKDQILALNFVKSNIKYFGGNANSVTIMGMSAGGASVHFHYLSPKSRGLFHRGFSQSGCTLNPWVLMEKPLEKSKKLATILGCSSENLEKMLECLRKRPARQIVQSVAEFQPWLYNPFTPFGVVIDSWSSNPVLPSHPYIIIKNKQVYDVPWIISYTNSEGLYPAADFYINEEYLNELDARWDELLPHILHYNYTAASNLHSEISQKIRKYYMKDKKLSKATYKDLIPIISDRIFVNDIQKTARWQSSVTKSSIYTYYFAYRGAHSWSDYRAGSKENFGASHGDDTTYAFKINAVDTTTTQSDRKMIKVFVDLITSFAKTGKPLVPVEWPPLSKNPDDGFLFLQIESPEKFSIKSGITNNSQFWDSLPIIENDKLFADKIKDEL